MKPSLIAAVSGELPPLQPVAASLSWLSDDGATAVIVDLPAIESIDVGVTLGRKGWCVIPMFNTLPDATAVLPTGKIMAALKGAAPMLPEMPNGPPVFLLDSGRQTPPASMPRPAPVLSYATQDFGDFDNRWNVFRSDFPSSEFFASQGIRRLAIVSREKDLLVDLRDALAGHGSVDRIVTNPDTGEKSPFPKTRGALVRAIAHFGRVFDRNPDGTFGHRISHG